MPSDAVVPRLSTLQQQRSRETRGKLVAAAAWLWRSKGFDETSVSDVCDAAGVSKGTFYFYFVRKEDLLVELALGGAERADRDREAAATGDDVTTADAMRQVVDGIASRSERTPPVLLARTIQELLAMAGRWHAVRGERTDFRQIFASLLERGRARGEVRESHDPGEVGQMMSVVTLQGMLHWAISGAEEPLADVLWRRVGVILYGVSTTR